MTSLLTSTNDVNLTSASFVDLTGGDYQLNANSPCINKGVDTGAPTVDIMGNPSFGTVDIGAYEYQGLVSIEDHDLINNTINIYPNRTGDLLNFSIENTWSGAIPVRVIDINGIEVLNTELNKHTNVLTHNLDISNLPAGVYQSVIIKFRF